MSSTTPGQTDSYLSAKPTPEADVHSLQLNKEHITSSITPVERPVTPVINQDAADDSRNDVPQIPKDNLGLGMKREDHKPTIFNPDETIQSEFKTTNDDEKRVSPQSVIIQPSDVLNSGIKIEKDKDDIVAAVSESSETNIDLSKNDTFQDNSKVSAYARLEFENFIFYVQTLQVVLGRKSEHDQSHSVDVHLGASKAISRKHAKIFYNFGTERFELSIQGKNGAFVDDIFVERGATVPLKNKAKIQIGQIVFRFVLPGANPQEKLESPSKPINPSDAISLRSTLYQSTDGVSEDNSGESTPQLTSKDFEPVNTSISLSNDANAAKKPTIVKKIPKPPKPPKKVYTIDEIPEEYRTKPNCSYSNLIATCLRTHGTPKGMSLAEIYKSIKENFPYYKYCPDGWQSSVRHNLSLNKAFKKVSKEGKGWLWGLDEEYCAEKERAKKKQAAAAAAKAKAAALKLEQQQQQQKQQQQRLEQQRQLQLAQAAQQQLQQQNLQPGINATNITTTTTSYNQPTTLGNIHFQKQITIPNVQPDIGNIDSPKSQSNIQVPKKPGDIQLQTNSNVNLQTVPLQQPQPAQPTGQNLNNIQAKPAQINLSQIPVFQSSNNANHPQLISKTPSIQAQLAANRGMTASQSPRISPQPTTNSANKTNTLNADTKKALTHLQQQLVILSKDLRTLVDKPTISAILTQAIAMTIAQVTQAAKTKGITTDPLATLIETNPQQLTRILTVALNAATYKVTNGRIKAPLSVPQTGNSSTPVSRPSTPNIQPNSTQNSNTNSPIISNISSKPIPQPVQIHQQQVPFSQPQPSSKTSGRGSRAQKTQVPQIPVFRPQANINAALLSRSNPLVNKSAPPTQAPSPTLQEPPVLQRAQTSVPATSISNNTNVKPEGISSVQGPKSGVSGITQTSTPITLEEKSKSPATATPIEPTKQVVTNISPVKPIENTVSSNHATIDQAQAEETITSKNHVDSVSTETPQGTDDHQMITPVPTSKDAETTDNSTSKTDSGKENPKEPVHIASQEPNHILNSTAKATEPSGSAAISETPTDFNFLNDDLHDPELDKVIESFSKEGTPGVDDGSAVMNDEELNKLLSSDFTINHHQDTGPQKRTIDEIDSSFLEESQNKLPKTQ